MFSKLNKCGSICFFMKFVNEIKKEKGMNVSGVIYASPKIFDAIKDDKTISQVKNVSMLPGIIGKSIALPDAHQGYGFSIGGVAAFDLENGIISPGGVGYDINCGVRMLRTNLTKKDILKFEDELLNKLYEKIPSGVGHGGKFQISKKELNNLLVEGVNWMIKKGYGEKEDSLFIEENGCISGADYLLVSDRAKSRGIGQLGTLGAGNHFLEVQYVDEIFDKDVAKAFGLKKDEIVVMIHCGSRGLGHQVASDYIKKMEEEYGIKNLPDRELINAPIKSDLGKKYFSAMNASANFAFANRQAITYSVRQAFKEIFPNSKVSIIYDVCHNIAKIEEHIIDGKKKKVCVHRKGATRSFGPNRVELPEEYRNFGQPVLIPGSMGTSSYILVGTKKSEELTFGSTVHGAGRVMSRTKAIHELTGEKVKKEIEKKGIKVKVGNIKSLAEEAPNVYKDIEDVVEVVHELGLSKKVARLKPLLVVKG